MTDPTPIFALCADHVERAAAADPLTATYDGVGGHDGESSDLSPAGHAARADVVRDTLRRLAGLSPQSPADLLAADHLRERLTATLAWHDAGEPLRELHPFAGHLAVRGSVELLPQETEEQWAVLTRRLSGVPGMLAGWRESLDAGLRGADRVAVRQVAAAAEQLAVFAGERVDAPAHASLVDRVTAASPASPVVAELTAAARAAHAAYAETSSWLTREAAPRAAEADGVGRDRWSVWSSLAMGARIDPQEAYAWGWEELHRLEDAMAVEADRVQAGAGVAEAAALLDRTDVVTGAEAYRSWLQDQHDEAMVAVDGVHVDVDPRLRTVDVRLAPAGSAAAPYYTPPTEDLSRPGRTWWPTLGREVFPVWDEVTTVFHEGVPGHHLQFAQAKVADLSRYSRNSFVSGHGEGWALYAERLADELGWFTTPGRRLGYLIGSAFRAARVVIDIGVHLGLPLPPAEAARHGERWTFDVARQVLRERGRLGAHMVDSEVTRYFGWPAQAPSYKLGERAWLEARDEARTRLGSQYDQKAWHTAALALGPLGLDTMSAQLRGWQG